jgi:hypothetical protein
VLDNQLGMIVIIMRLLGPVRMTSCATAPPRCKSLRFVTAYPLHPLDENDLLSALWELPHQHSEMEKGADAALLAGLVASSHRGDHAAIVSLFHPPFFMFASSAETYQPVEKLRHSGMMPSSS